MMRRIAAPLAPEQRALPASDGDEVRGSRLPQSGSVASKGPKPCKRRPGQEAEGQAASCIADSALPGRANVSAAGCARFARPGLLGAKLDPTQLSQWSYTHPSED